MTTTDLRKERASSIYFALTILVIMAIPASIAYKLYSDDKAERQKEYSLSCSAGFQSAYGERPWSYEKSTRWSTPSGSYVQKPGEACRVFYRLKESK
jgi:hypothetical protein